MMVGQGVRAESILFVTLDSCRYDTFVAADTPALDRVAPALAALAPSHFTFGSHSAMFKGFTPAATTAPVPLLNPKFGKPFKLMHAGFTHGQEGFALAGSDIIEGFAAQGYGVFGSGAAGWFDPAVAPSASLIASFPEFLYPGDLWSAPAQVAWLTERIEANLDRPIFAFLNVGETHVPYWYPGAPWPFEDHPCRPFQTVDRREDCAIRQRACLEYLDPILAPLVDRFLGATILICGDHGDCWGEDGLWEHGVSHPMTLTVPMLLRFRGEPIALPPGAPAAA